ncbi:MAG: sterol desaturase family protein [Hyphomonadaceae bacterium]|nr:MAG: fatty acid hydroxylase [Caulobacteraceae bacterium]MBT9446137.1 sterol desaturase family protein [Hyphomonadaceae bacterium]
MHDLIHTLAAGNPIAENWLGSTFHDVSRYVIFAVGVWLTLWVVLQRPLAGRKIRADNPPARQMIVEFLVSIRSVAIFSTIGLATFLLDRAGWLPGPKLAASWGPAWFWGSLVLMIIAHDAYFYWAHRLLHRPQLFRAFHRRHHRSMNPTPFTAYSFDLGEAAVMASFVPAWMILVPTQWEVTGLFMLHQIVRNTMGHAGYELMPATKDGRPLFDWLTTTTHHDLHHAQAGWNYGLYFTFWDRLMGTEHPEYHARFAQAVRKPLRAPVRAPAKAAAALLVGALLLGGAATDARAEATQSIAGDWATRGFGSLVRFSACQGAPDTLCGRIIWLWEIADERARPRNDRRNPDPALRNRSLVGVEIIRGMRETSPGVWTGGSLYNPDDGRTYTGEIRLRNGALVLKGCALNIVCQTQTWRKPDDILNAVRGLQQ